MKRPLAFAALSILFLYSPNSFAQLKKPGVTLGANLFYANPEGAFKNSYKGGLGAEVKGGLGLGKTYLVATLGYAAFAAQASNNTGTLTYSPLKIGLKHYVLAKRIFINGDVGAARLKNKTMSESESRLSADIGAGVRLFGLEAGVYKDTWKNSKEAASKYSSNVSFKIGYNISL